MTEIAIFQNDLINFTRMEMNELNKICFSCVASFVANHYPMSE